MAGQYLQYALWPEVFPTPRLVGALKWHRQTHTHTDVATLWLYLSRGQCSEREKNRWRKSLLEILRKVGYCHFCAICLFTSLPFLGISMRMFAIILETQVWMRRRHTTEPGTLPSTSWVPFCRLLAAGTSSPARLRGRKLDGVGPVDNRPSAN